MKYNSSGYVIRISENALIQMCLNGLEAYIVTHKENNEDKSKLETFGLLWGHESTLTNQKTLYSIELLSIDTSAVRKSNSCEPNDLALELKRDIMTSFWPHYDFLGDFHTHPYNNYRYVRNNKLYLYSEQDRSSIEDFTSSLKL
ncbi:MAG: hypothetical protein PHT62_02570 [Desulfotomaculaceae bacterium]|nr:hypothetical protein [Desulfotomaculaceae bacterium]